MNSEGALEERASEEDDDPDVGATVLACRLLAFGEPSKVLLCGWGSRLLSSDGGPWLGIPWRFSGAVEVALFDVVSSGVFCVEGFESNVIIIDSWLEALLFSFEFGFLEVVLSSFPIPVVVVGGVVWGGSELFLEVSFFLCSCFFFGFGFGGRISVVLALFVLRWFYFWSLRCLYLGAFEGSVSFSG